MSAQPDATTPPELVRVAAAQFFSGNDVAANLRTIVGYMRQAVEVGAQLLVTPENSNRVRDFRDRADAYAKSETLHGDFVRGLQAAAAELGLMLAVGVDLRGESEPDTYIGQVLIDSTGELLHVHYKTVLWDYEYGLFVPSSRQLEVVPTRIGRIGMLMCADGIVPEVPRVLGLKGAQILVNSLNSRGPDEMRVHEPLRAIENHVWHVAANTVGGPADGYPWTGGSQVISPRGEILANAGEVGEGLVWADITPATSHPKVMDAVGALDEFRRPDLYGELLAGVDTLPAASIYGPVPEGTPARPLNVVTAQTSWYHATSWTLTRTAGQIQYAAVRGAQLAVFPEYFIHPKDSIGKDPHAAAELAEQALAVVSAAAAEHRVWVVAHLVERGGDQFFSTAYLISDAGEIFARYRKAHLTESERAWAAPGEEFVVADTPIGRIGMMIGEEVWLPEVMRILSLRGAEVIAHPVSWDRREAATQAAVERTEENRTHLVSCARTDNPGGLGSQIVVADRFIPGQPIAVMRFPTTITCRTGFEENIFHTLDLTDSHSKMQGLYLDPLATRQPELYGCFLDRFADGAEGHGRDGVNPADGAFRQEAV